MDATIVFPSARLEIPAALKTVGYTEAESLAVYHHHVAPMSDNERVRFLSMVYAGILSRHLDAGRYLVVTSPGH